MTTTELAAEIITNHIESEGFDFWEEETFDTKAGRLGWLKGVAEDLAGEHFEENELPAAVAEVFAAIRDQEPRIKAWNREARKAA